MFKKTTYFLILIFFVTSCADSWDSVKRGLTGEKRNTADEFLIKKKDPLILPPQYDKLPLPDSSDFQEKKENGIKSILKTGKNSETKKSSSMSSVEKKILEELRKN